MNYKFNVSISSLKIIITGDTSIPLIITVTQPPLQMLKIKHDSHLIKCEIVPTEQPRNLSQNAHDKLTFAVLYIGHRARLFDILR